MTDDPNDLAPSIDQLDVAAGLVSELGDARSGYHLIHGFSGHYDAPSGDFIVCVSTTEEPEEIYASPAMLMHRIHADATITTAVIRDRVPTARETLRARLEAADVLADGEAVDAYGDLSTAVRAFLAATEADAR